MLGRPKKLYVGDQLLNARTLGHKTKGMFDISNPFDYIALDAFQPSPSIITIINKAIKTGNPLLISGDRYMRELVARSVAYEINTKHKPTHSHYFCEWKIRKGQNFRNSLYHFDHEAKKRDLEYYQIHPKANPRKENEYYFKAGPIVRLLEMIKTDPVRQKNPHKITEDRPILEIQDVHLADENFIIELMEFLHKREEIFIPEINKKIQFDLFNKPLIILTAPEEFQLPENYDGVIYQHQIAFPEKGFFMDLFTPKYSVFSSKLTTGSLGFKKLSKECSEGVIRVLELMVDLFYITRDNDLLQTKNNNLPLTIPQLNDAVDTKVMEIKEDQEALDQYIKELELALQSQTNLGSQLNAQQISQSIKKLIRKNKIKEALRTLNLIEKRLKKDQQLQLIQLNATLNDINFKERMGTESELILIPMRNKLKFDILTLTELITN